MNDYKLTPRHDTTCKESTFWIVSRFRTGARLSWIPYSSRCDHSPKLPRVLETRESRGDWRHTSMIFEASRSFTVCPQSSSHHAVTLRILRCTELGHRANLNSPVRTEPSDFVTQDLVSRRYDTGFRACEHSQRESHARQPCHDNVPNTSQRYCIS